MIIVLDLVANVLQINWLCYNWQ